MLLEVTTGMSVMVVEDLIVYKEVEGQIEEVSENYTGIRVNGGYAQVSASTVICISGEVRADQESHVVQFGGTVEVTDSAVGLPCGAAMHCVVTARGTSRVVLAFGTHRAIIFAHDNTVVTTPERGTYSCEVELHDQARIEDLPPMTR